MMPGYQASDSENAYDFFFRFFLFQSDRPTQYQETHSTVNEKKKRKKKRGTAQPKKKKKKSKLGLRFKLNDILGILIVLLIGERIKHMTMIFVLSRLLSMPSLSILFFAVNSSNGQLSLAKQMVINGKSLKLN